MKRSFWLTFVVIFFASLISFEGFCVAQDVDFVEKEVTDIQPLCRSDQDCMRPGVIGICQSPGEKMARCLWQEVAQIPIIAIVPKNCRTCQPEAAIRSLQQIFLGIQPRFVNEDDVEAKELIKHFKIKNLPAYIFSKDVERDPSFSRFLEMSIEGDSYYYLKPQFSGVSYFLDRKPKRNQLDLFLTLGSTGMFQPVKIAEEIYKDKSSNINLELHFLGIKNTESGTCVTPGGQREQEEEKIFACVDNYYPEKSFDYLSCRLLKINSIWFEDCLKQNNINVDKIKKCAQSKKGQKLFEKMIKMSQDLNVRYAPIFLMDNVEIFGVTDQTTSEEIIGIIQSFKK